MMIRSKKSTRCKVALTTVLTVLLTSPILTGSVSAAGHSMVEAGKALAVSRTKGNCLACHAFDGGALPGNMGPPLLAMKARFPDKAKLRAQIWDAAEANPETVMVPFGRHRVLTEGEIDKIVEYIWTL